jgi:hypothetical protein
MLIAILVAISLLAGGLAFIAAGAAMRTWWGRAPAAAAAGAIEALCGIHI